MLIKYLIYMAGGICVGIAEVFEFQGMGKLLFYFIFSWSVFGPILYAEARNEKAPTKRG